MAKENVIHIKFDNTEAVAAKRDILTSQMNLLKVAKTIEGYGFYRIKELELKLTLSKKMKELKTSMKKLQKILPKLKVPEILRKGETREPEEEHEEKRAKKSRDKSLEGQLQEIQRRLERLQNRHQ